MLFTHPIFLYGFFPLFFTGYLLVGPGGRNLFVLLGSLAFYAWGEPWFVAVVALSVLADFYLGAWIWSCRGRDQAAAKGFLALGVCLNVGLLAVFKYTDFILRSLEGALRTLHPVQFHLAHLLLPLGISFITFEKITYLADLYWGVGRPARSLLNYATYVFLFPKLLAGPILQYHDLEGQLGDRPRRWEDLAWGLKRFTVGLAKKTLVADTLGPLADKIFTVPVQGLEPRLAWIGLLAFTLQIYFDFSGYSDMAIGMARMMGFRIKENFNQPYTAVSFTDFWRRWHISLGAWIKRYLYIPLGGNRVSAPRAAFNLVLCFFISGLWHGANWTFVVWGLYHGFFMVMDKFLGEGFSRKAPAGFRRAATFFLVMMGWVLFRSPSLGGAWDYAGRLWGWTPFAWPGTAGVVVPLPLDYFTLMAGLGWVLLPALWPGVATPFTEIRDTEPLRPLPAFGFFLLLVLCLVKISGASFSPFIYFRF